MGIWNAEYECMDRERLYELQGERLRSTVKRVYENVPYYRQKMKEKGVEPGDIKNVDDLKKLPFTCKQDLRNTYPYGLFAVPMEEVVRIHASSGTTGKRTVVGYTAKDIETWAEIMARCLTAAGADRTSFVHVAYGYGLFTGGLGVHYGAEKIGATVIPVSGGNTKLQIQIMKDFGSTILTCTPSYALYIAETMREMGIDPKKDLKLKAGIFGAEPWTEAMRREIESQLGIKAHDIYGLSEVIGPGVAVECECQSGMHIQEDHFIVEVIDPETEEPLPIGSEGELVFTCITKEALPLIRYRTRDVARLTDEKCPCGRTQVRMSKVLGRTDDMLIIRGVNVYPSQIESVLLELGLSAPYYQLIVDRVGPLDSLEVQVEMTPEMFSDQVKQIEAVENKIRHNIESTLGLSCKVRLVEPKTIQRSEGKAKRVIDKRNLK
ncbi:phenylacetate-coenzyme A ligase PaaK [Thermoclostridium stercorarium subsp. stercorarium DSM 8532]|uniref:Phenylacetate-coenzyme A ligase n=2 Tax=Thermoclostridium stercorarium TaxID=1510 RepID=L7VIC2_THES1|nr:phenylacetate--CoA ligase [Thermoclostridium stercorarium]AGC67800.1 phenylacetate-coenzyme A ligase PaaK [Thermoclostridium stercorarium subsp. stercorarium DSM 8532]AGI38844.1 phenylacetate-CoA ligase [Thermoclostridium stercorarium subsp. stercorarium DSM 8532]ANW98202.1 phenylacetate--CoA ligase [Thermoclostridium stercorarium subsp. thermolacticum DSM 2910]